jgi:hypothetical protein
MQRYILFDPNEDMYAGLVPLACASERATNSPFKKRIGYFVSVNFERFLDGLMNVHG